MTTRRRKITFNTTEPKKQLKKEAPAIPVKLSLSSELTALYDELKHLNAKISHIEKKLIFTVSEPLLEYKMKLMREHMQCLAKMTDTLTS